MNSLFRERFSATLAHQPVDRCPVDFGGTPFTNLLDPSMLFRVARHLGIARRGDDAAAVLEAVQRRWDTDFRRVGALLSLESPRKRTVSEVEHVDEYGITHAHIGGRWEITGHPLKNASLDDVIRYEFPVLSAGTLAAIEGYGRQARRLFDDSPHVVVGEHPVFGVLELACWLCGYDTILEKMCCEPEFVHLLFDRILDFQLKISGPYFQHLGRHIHVMTSGDDFGAQHGMFMGLEMWREFVKPRMGARHGFNRKFTDAAWFHHSCGAVSDLIPDLARIGVSILNPVQTTAAGMNAPRLKSEFGGMMVFHGGFDTQGVLPGGDAEEIRKEAERLIRAMKPRESGGFIFAPAHNIQNDVAPESVAAMYAAALELAGADF